MRKPVFHSPADFKQVLSRALSLDFSYLGRSTQEMVSSPQFQQLKSQARRSAVLVLFSFDIEKMEPFLLLTQRTEKVETHKGQMAFPGGLMKDAESPIPTALRETEEEVGIAPSTVEIVGMLPELTTLSTGFWIQPVVGIAPGSAQKAALNLNSNEIEEAFWVPLSEFSKEGVYRLESFSLGEVKVPTHVYQIEKDRSYVVWGATAAMIKNLLDRLAKV